MLLPPSGPKYWRTTYASTKITFASMRLPHRKGTAFSGNWGVVEALVGALCWAALLIGISFVLKYAGVDLVEIFHKVAGH
jgi:hypothetical protein